MVISQQLTPGQRPTPQTWQAGRAALPCLRVDCLQEKLQLRDSRGL